MLDDKINITKRKLPHWTQINSVYFITFTTKKLFFDDIEKTIIFNHIIEGNNKYYKLHAVVVMPDHVHLILEASKGYELSRIMKGIKGVTAHLINKKRFKNGSIWLKESYDRIIRDENEYGEKLIYMYNNSLKKGLVENPEDYKWWFLSEEF
jgi:REP element-mobilizing transposase RayT